MEEKYQYSIKYFSTNVSAVAEERRAQRLQKISLY